MPERPKGLRGQIGALAQSIYPNLDERAFIRERNRLRSAVIDLHDLSTLPCDPVSSDTPSHVVVVPSEGNGFRSWGPGLGNFYYEVAGNLADTIGESRVSVFHVAKGTSTQRWHRELLEFLIDSKATHLITHIESDPGSEGSDFTWDAFMDIADSRWGGVLLGVMFDSAYRHVTFRSRVIARRSPRFMVVDICMPMNDSMRKGRPEVGPVNRPMSAATLELISQCVSETPKQHDISFIGVLYPYRLELIEKLKALGLSVAVNPHRKNSALNTNASREHQPSWLDYIGGLASSRATINFSQSSAGPIEQLKWRVVEAGLANTFLFTDDQNRTRLFWDESTYGFFSEPAQLPIEVEKWFHESSALEEASEAFHMRALEVSRTQFWADIERGLEMRRLPSISKALLNN
jgi:hypothetical protein